MGQLFMNLATLLGGVGGILIGVGFVAIVFAFLLLPILFMVRKDELIDTEENRDLRRGHKRPMNI